MFATRSLFLLSFAALLGMAGCATRPVNPPLTHVDPETGYRFQTREPLRGHPENVLILAFSGGGTRAAAFSYGVLEALRDINVVTPSGRKTRLLDAVGVITGVSGGSFTALAFGLYGDKLFDVYETSFLKRDVQGELVARAFNPLNWGALSTEGWGRSELAADLYDEILFRGATFSDLARRPGPMIVASATDVSTGARFYYTQTMFDILCSDIGGVRLSRAAASSSAVPVVLSPITFNNYGGSCDFREPPWLERFAHPDRPLRPAARAMRQLAELRAYEDGEARPYIHLVDGGVSDNLGMRGILDIMDELEALRLLGIPTALDNLKRIAVIVVNSLSKPKIDWDRRLAAPGIFSVLMQATGVPIDHYSYETIDLLRDTATRWKSLRAIRDSADVADRSKPAFLDAMRVPEAEIYVVDVSFAEIGDAAERDYLNSLPTSFVLPPEAVDRLRAAAGQVIMASPEFRRLLTDVGVRVLDTPASRGAPAP